MVLRTFVPILQKWLLAALILLAPLSFVPSVSVPLFHFPSFRLGLYQLLALVFIAITCVPAIKAHKKLYTSHKLAFGSLVGLGGTALMGLLWATDTPRSALLIASVLFLLLLLYCGWWVAKDSVAVLPAKYIRIFIIAALVYGGLAIVQFVYGTFFETGGLLCKGCKPDVFGFPRVNLTAAEPLFFANALLPFLFGIFWLAIHKIRYSRLGLIAICIAIGLTFSRGAYIAVLAGFFIFLIYYSRTRTHRALLGAPLAYVSIGFIVAFCMFIASATIQHHATISNITYITIDSTLEHVTVGVIDLPDQAPQLTSPPTPTTPTDTFTPPGLIEASTTERTSSANLALKAFTSTPRTVLIGTGLGSLGPYVVQNISPTAPYTLTVYIFYILLLAEVGSIGIIAYLLLLGSVAYALVLRAHRYTYIVALLALFVAFIVQYMFFGSYINGMYIWLWLGIMLGITSRKSIRFTGIIQKDNEK